MAEAGPSDAQAAEEPAAAEPSTAEVHEEDADDLLKVRICGCLQCGWEEDLPTPPHRDTLPVLVHRRSSPT
jgi:hypothetical protein